MLKNLPKEIQYLGHILGTEGIKPVPAKTEAIKAMHPPVNPKQVRTFLGLVGYYRKFIKNFAKIAKPLTMLTQMDIKFEWKETHHCAFMKLKEATIQAPILRYPDTTKSYIVYTDASRRHLQSSALTDTQWNRIPGSFLIAYIYRHPKEMEYTRTRSIRYLLRHQEMELLPTRSRHHSKK